MLIIKYGVILDSKQCTETLAISSHTLDERRKKAVDCPEYIEAKKRNNVPTSKLKLFDIKNIIRYNISTE